MSTDSDDEQGCSKRRHVTTSIVQKKKSKGTSRCPAINAIRNIEILQAGTKIRLHVEPGWESVLPKTNEDDPGCLIMWDDDNMAATVKNFNAAIAAAVPGAPVPPAWLNIAGLITIPGLKLAILNHVQISAGGGGVVGNCLIAPNTEPPSPT